MICLGVCIMSSNALYNTIKNMHELLMLEHCLLVNIHTDFKIEDVKFICMFNSLHYKVFIMVAIICVGCVETIRKVQRAYHGKVYRPHLVFSVNQLSTTCFNFMKKSGFTSTNHLLKMRSDKLFEISL